MKTFNSLFELYQYCAFCPICQKNTRATHLKYRDENYSTKPGYQKGKYVSFNAYSNFKLTQVNGVEFEIKFILDQANNAVFLKTNPLYVKYLKYLHLKAFPNIPEGHSIAFVGRCDRKSCGSSVWTSNIMCNFHQRTIINPSDIVVCSENVYFDNYNIFYYLETQTNLPKWRISTIKNKFDYSKSLCIDALDVEFADYVNLRRKLQTAMTFA